MKNIIIAIATLMFLAAPAYAGEKWTIQPQVPDYSRPFMEPGSASNHYVVRERRDGTAEIKSQYQDFSRPWNEPGSPNNPIIIRPVR